MTGHRTASQSVTGEDRAANLVMILARASVWFQCEPQPDNEWQVTVKVEDFPRLVTAVGVVNRGTTLVHHITHDEENDDMTCTCGNTTHRDGFVACDENGLEVEPLAGIWEGRYRCQSCGATININPEGRTV
jgi:hypothetical protein